MICLREMKAAEFSAYCDYFITDYSREIMQNYGHAIEIATTMAQQELQRCFPNGLDSNEHQLLCIDSDNDDVTVLIGYLWHCMNSSDSSTFIYDFYIDDDHRNQGYGKQAISQLETMLMAQGIVQIKLRVAYHNQRALSLYQDVGFTISGYNMSKCLQP